MSVVAILGAGELGGAIAHKLAIRARVREILLVDPNGAAAAGKALDIQQSGPIEPFDTRLSANADALAAVGASVIVVADAVASGQWKGEAGLGLVRQLARAGASGPFVFAGPDQLWLLEAAAREVGVRANRLVGTAPSALVGMTRALVALETNGAAADVLLSVVGRPPSVVLGWSSATLAGSLVTDCVPAHRLRAISDAVRRLWPPGAHAIAAATAQVVEALASGSRRRLHALTLLDGELGARGTAAMLPVELGEGQVLRRIVPSLSPQERTELINSLG